MMWKITVTMLGGGSAEIDVLPTDTVGILKERIQAKMSVPLQNQRLVFVNGCRMELNDDTKTISSYGMRSGSQVSLLVIQTPVPTPTPVVETFEVFLVNDKGKTIPYDVTATETVGNFKKRVQSREGVPVNQMYLVYEGRSMSDDKLTLNDYGVKPHGTIYLTLQLRGG